MKAVLFLPFILFLSTASASEVPVPETPPSTQTPPRNLTHTRVERRTMPLSPELEKKIAELADRCLPEQKNLVEQHMQELIQRIDETVQLTPDQKTSLEKSATTAIEQYLPVWKTAFIGPLRLIHDSLTPVSLKASSGWSPQHLVNVNPVPDPPLPDQSDHWNTALAAVLSPEALARWKQTVEKNRAANEETLQNHLKPKFEKVRESMQETLHPLIVEINSLTQAPIEKIDQLEKLSNRLVDSFSNAMFADITALQRNIPSPTRKSHAKQGGLNTTLIFPSIALQNEFETGAAAILSPQELATWRTGAKERDEKLRRELVENTKPLAGQYRESFQQQFQLEVANIVATLDFPDDRKKLLEKAGDDALNDYFEDWQKALVTHLLTLPEAQREEVLGGSRGFSLGMESENQPRKHPAWEQRKNLVLTPEETQRWKTSLEERRQRICDAYAHLFIAEIDKQVALSSAQRAPLFPITQKLVSKQLEQFNFDYTTPTHFHQTYFLNMTETEDGKELATVLTPRQWEHWKSLRERQRQQPPKPSEDLAGLDPEIIIARHLHHLDQRERAQRLSQMQMHTDEATRIATLSEKAAAHLNTAAKGAVESTMDFWRKSMANYMRQQTRQTTPEALQQRLNGLGSMRFSNNEPQAEDHPIWKTAVVQILPEDRRQTWKDEQSARARYLNEAIATNVLAQLNQQSPISTDHAETLKPHIIEVLTDHSHEFLGWFSDGWYYSPHQVLTPICGVPEDVLKTTFTEKRLTTLRETVLAQGQSYWDSIKQQREQRLKNEERRRKAKK
ncbi:hypothetical protein FEM03_09700 [Phragmitibacter flavus]|uniref:Uncharacterized protein n=1 Tax=Phragmitibacter flavus TaxID=2576071 RepID=A0A5R8KFV4_9BACT|nr:hypothetical protein [Phragmitibacter flavus]TLD71170.1 hypothetical protein FEM03_09700 [Phragmitibacter flavus]